jgi:hypothetical protein
MFFIAGRFDGEAPRSARALARWAGTSGDTLILSTGEHGTDLFGSATPQVERRTTESILDFLAGLGGGSTASVIGDGFDHANRSSRPSRMRVSRTSPGSGFANEDQILASDPCEGADEAPYVYFFEASGRWGHAR